MTVGCEETDNVALARVVLHPVHATCISGTTKVQLHPRHHQLSGIRTKSPTCDLRKRLASHIFDRHIENANTYYGNFAVFFGRAVCVWCIRGLRRGPMAFTKDEWNTKKSRLTPTHKGNRVPLAAASYIVVCCIVPVFFFFSKQHVRPTTCESLVLELCRVKCAVLQKRS